MTITAASPPPAGRSRAIVAWLAGTAGPLITILWLDHLAVPALPWDDLPGWLDVTPPGAALLALAALAVRVAAVWVLVSTVAIGLAVLLDRPRLLHVAGRLALPAVRKAALATVTRVAAVSLVVTPVLGPIRAVGAPPAPPPPAAESAHERDRPLPPFPIPLPDHTGPERPDGDVAGEDAPGPAHPLPPFLPAETRAATAPAPPPPVAPDRGARHRVAPGDHLWGIAARVLTETSATPPDDGDIARYWVKLVAANRDRVRSGDPDLIFPGEVILLPEVGPR